MLSYTDALEKIDATVEPVPPDSRALEHLAGAATAADIASRMDVPAFANAAMDGFALRAADTNDARTDNLIQLEVTGIAAAGDRPSASPPPGAAIEIMTGAPIPAGCDAVIPIERVQTVEDNTGRITQIRIPEASQPGRNVRAAAEDFRLGQTVLGDRQEIEPHDVMALAATGSDHITSRAMPRIAVITTGSELADRGTPSEAGLIRDANGPYLEAFIRRIGADQTRRFNVADRPEDLDAAFQATCDAAEVILTTGGVSAGRYDLVPDAITRAGGEIIFHKVAIRPGKPILFARMANGTLVFGLPGNPIAAAVGLRFFVVPALRRLQGLPREQFHVAVSEDQIRKRAEFCFFGKASAHVDSEGRLRSQLLPGQESFRIQPLVASNCWVIAPEGPAVIDAGELIWIAPLYPTRFLQKI